MTDKTAASSGTASAAARVWASPLYRGATLAMLLSGLGASAAAPQIVLFLVRQLGTPLPVAGLYYLTSLAAPVAGYLVGRRSDRTGRRLGLFRFCALAGAVGWAWIALATAAWVPFVISALVLAVSGAAASQLFAAVHDAQQQEPGGADDRVVGIIRMALTAGWVIGPALGAWFASVTSLRAMLWGTAILFAAQILPLGGRRDVAAPKVGAEAHAPAPGFGAMLPLLAFTGLFVLVYCTEPVRYGYLLMYMEDPLKIAPALRGGVIGLQPLVELAVMPFAVALGRRFGEVWSLCLAAALAVAANLCFALWSSLWGMVAGQALMGVVWGIFFVLGLIVAQRLLPGAVATASAIFMNAGALGLALGGVAGGLGVSAFGLPGAFFIPAGFALLAVVGLAVMARAGGRPA